MTVYYNEIDPYAAQWLRNLIAGGHLPAGDVDTRSIVDVSSVDLIGYAQCHFFAGIGGWPLALRIAGWPDEKPIWTGSPPCQDHSVAGSVWNVRAGIEGKRGALVRPWLAFIGEHEPSDVLFENVPGIAPALAEIEGRLESFGYSLSRSERSSADIGAPHLRRRVWRFAHRDGERRQERWPPGPRSSYSDPRRAPPGDVWVASARRSCGLDDGFPARVAAVRAYGNAIDPWAAASVIRELAL